MKNIVDYRNLKSVMAEHSNDRTTSDRYNFIPTIQVIDLLERNGWIVSDARETNARNDRQGFQKHLIRFRRAGDEGKLLEVNEIIPEIQLSNAHDGSAAFNIMAAFERCWCSNQCTVADSTIANHRVLHKGYNNEKILEAVYQIVEDTPKVLESVDRFKAIPLNVDERKIFAEASLNLLYSEEKLLEYDKKDTLTRLLRPKRTQDTGENLWTTYNIVQEKFLKGDRFLTEEGHYRAKKTKQIKSIDKDIKLNKALWTLTEAMANLKETIPVA